MKLLVVGGGGREHALVWKLKQSPRVPEILAAPGNAGIAQIAHCKNIVADDVPGLLALAKAERVDLVVVGPEQPLSLGIADAFAREGIRCFGPGMRAAELESSKSFAKLFMQKYRIPTAHYGIFTDAREAKAFVRREGCPIVIKADGLAQGKGVMIAQTAKDAERAIDAMLKFGAYGKASEKIVIEQFLSGEEVSCIAIVDGRHFVLLESAQDHKALLDGDKGPNTGGMGAYSPASLTNVNQPHGGGEGGRAPSSDGAPGRMTGRAPVIDLSDKVCHKVFAPAIDGLMREGRPFVGFLYAGLMIVDREPYVLEFNVRMGDPEAQAILMRLKSDIVPALIAACDGSLDKVSLEWEPRASACVVMAAGGYPEAYKKGEVITGLDAVADLQDVCVFHAGTALRDGSIVTNGGRVLGITALGANVTDAVSCAYSAVEKIGWDGVYYRKDIGWRALDKERGL